MKNYSYGYLFRGVRKSEPSTIYFFKEVWYQHNPTTEELDKDLDDFIFEEGAAYNHDEGRRISDFIGVAEAIEEDGSYVE